MTEASFTVQPTWPEANREAIEDAGLSYIIGARIPEEPYHVKKWRRDHPGEDIPDGHVFTAPWPATGAKLAADLGRWSTVLLFCRTDQKGEYDTAPYVFLGPAACVSHIGERPIAITWGLRHAMPTAFSKRAALAAS